MKTRDPFKRTPEAEAYRVQRLREVMQQPRPAEWCQHISEGVKRACAEGRMPAQTAEAVEKRAAKLRGRPRPPEVVEKIRQANIGKKRTPEQIEAMQQRQRELRAAGKYKASPEGAARQRAALVKANTGRIQSAEMRRQQSERMRGRVWDKAVVESRARPMRGRPQTAPATMAGPSNAHSIEGAVRDPAGRMWRFRNLSYFVRTHPHLFEPADMIERPLSVKRPDNKTCNAIKRLLALFGRGRVVPCSWKGWTAVSKTELGEDLIDRETEVTTNGPVVT